MVFHQQRGVSGIALKLLLAAFVVLSSSGAWAQEDQKSSAFSSIAKRVLLDPTTYAPALVAYDATIRDWNSSQPFFCNGFLEHNARLTVSGLPNDHPVNYQTGRQRILVDSLVHLEIAAFHNTMENIVEHALVERHP